MMNRRSFLTGAAAIAASPAAGQGRRVVITGHLGNIGSRIAARVAPNFVGIDKKLGPEFDLAELGPWVLKLVGAEVVVHLAAKAVFTATAEELRRDNLLATTNLLAACGRVGVRHIVYASSVGADPTLYGFPEETRTNAYCLSKLFGEELLRAAARHGLVSATAIRIGAAPPESTPCVQGGWPMNICVTTDELVSTFLGAMQPSAGGFTLVEMVGQKRILYEPALLRR